MTTKAQIPAGVGFRYRGTDALGAGCVGRLAELDRFVEKKFKQGWQKLEVFTVADGRFGELVGEIATEPTSSRRFWWSE